MCEGEVQSGGEGAKQSASRKADEGAVVLCAILS